jgi:hypothetical protein
VPRNIGTPDIGYHYSPIDYAVNLVVSNATVTVSPGIVLASYACNCVLDAPNGIPNVFNWGICLYDGAAINCQGTATSPNSIVNYNTVQEQSTTTWTNSWGVLLAPMGFDYCSASFGFTDWSVLAGDPIVLAQQCPVAMQNCQFYDGTVGADGGEPSGMTATNCLFQRVAFDLLDNQGRGPQTFCNNLFWRGSVLVYHWYNDTLTFRDNLFDQTLITNEYGTIGVCPSNAYVTGFTTLTSSYPPVTLSSSPAYEAGPLGQYYYPPYQPSLVFGGSQLASAAGLYHYTVTTNAYTVGGTNPDGTNVVSIGFHYVGVGTNGLPLSTPGDGIPDYIADSNGDGVYDTGDFCNWQVYYSLNGLSAANGLLVFTPLK